MEFHQSLKKIAEDCLRVGGEVLGPLPEDTRSRVRRLLYQVFEPIPPGREQDFLESLGDDFFIPKEADLRQLTDELSRISQERFVLFAEKFILRLGQYIVDLLEAYIMQIIDLVLNWETNLAAALTSIAQFLTQLEAKLTQLNQEVIDLFQTARDAVHDLLVILRGQDLRIKVKNEIKSEFTDRALDTLEDNDIYSMLPSEIRSSVRGLVGGAVNAVMDSPLLTPVFDAVNQLAGQLDDLLPDVRELDPEDNLPEQLMELILDKIEQNIRSHFGDGKPHISPTVDYTYQIWIIDDLLLNGHWETKHIYISIGRIDINISPFINMVKDAIRDLDFYHDALNNACFKLADAIAKELEYAATRLERDKQKAEKDKVDSINEEHNNSPKEIAILSPVTLEHFTRAIDFQIHLGGVPMSYLGLDEGEMNRVLIFINNQLIPVKSLIVEESLTVVNPDLHKEDFDYTKFAGGLTRQGDIKNASVHIITDTSSQIAIQAENRRKVNSGKTFPLGRGLLKEEVVSKVVYSAAANSTGSKIQLSRDISKDQKGRHVNTYRFDNLRPGGLKPASSVQDVLSNRLPGIGIRFKADLDEPFIVEGVNVITVVVIEKAGNRHQQNASFTVGRPAKIGKANRPILGIPGFNIEKTTLSINNVVRNRLNNAKDIATEEIRKEIEKTVGKPPRQPLVTPGTIVKTKKAVTTRVMKIEAVSVRDKNGKEIATHELVYSTAAEKAKQLKRFKLDTRSLVNGTKSLHSTKITYEKIEVPVDKEKIFDIKPLLNLKKPQLLDRMEASLQYLALQHDLNFKNFPRDKISL